MSAHTADLVRVGKAFGKTLALSDVSLSFRPGVITGLVGPNSSGKTTMLGVMAGRILPTVGQVVIGGGDVARDGAIAASTCLVGDGNEAIIGAPIRKTFRLYASIRPDWNHGMAVAMAEEFGLDLGKRPSALSLGKRSALAAVIGLASQASLTMFDEVTVGMDAQTRAAFTRNLLTSYAERPRTIVISSHLVDELGRTFEDVVVLSQGQVVHQGLVTDLLDSLCELTGRPELVQQVAAAGRVLQSEPVGPSLRAIVQSADVAARNTLWRNAEAAGLIVTDVPQQAAVAALTAVSR